MALAFLEILIQPLFEVVVWLLTAVVGLAIAELAYSVWLGMRWVIASDRGAHVLRDLHGATWSVRSTWRPWPSQWPLSKKLFGLRRRAPGESGRSEQHWLHPTQMAGRFDDALFLVAPFVVVVLLVFIAVFIVETVIVVLLVSVAASWRFVSRRSWRVQVAGPDGTVTTRAGLSFGEATTIAERVKATLRSSGSPDVEQAMSRRL
ncbi:MAG: hypothetical protein AB8G14_12105 [Ilumatobacter sp.]